MENELRHYGVLGMKWGRSKQRPRSADSERVKQLRKKNISELSNKELQDLNQRLNLERNYRDLTKRKSRIKSSIDTFVGVAGTITAVAGAAAVYKKYGGPACNKIIDTIGDLVMKDIKF